MHWQRAGLVIAPALLALGCSPQGEGAAKVEGGEIPLAQPSAAREAPGEPVPENLLGTWVYSHEQCEPDSEMMPDKRKIVLAVTFNAARSYEFDIEGFHFEGAYRYESGESPRITLDTMLNFAVEGDTLQNWSEGDAVYQCGRVFVREK